MTKLASLVSQMVRFFTLQTRMRTWVVAGLVTRQFCKPSLAVPVNMVVHVAPPLRDNWILILPVIPLEFHRIV